MKRILCGVISLFACHNSEPWTPVATRDTKDDPAQVRPGFGNTELHVWYPLAETEIAAIKEIDAAHKGDYHALLDLALVASGKNREMATFAQYRQRVESFVTEVKPTIDAADEWHKGYELHRAMHRVFFNGEKTDLGSYSLDAALLTDIFTTGHYNCISSALLYVVLARAFDLPVRGVLVPEHVFVEYGAPGGKLLEVETTSSTGFDWVHDERYYKEGAEDKFAKRLGLKPLTYDDYKKREVIEPWMLMAHAMRDARSGTDESDRLRLSEIAVLVAPEDTVAQKNAIYTWWKDAHDLHEQKSWHTVVKLFDTVAPSIVGVSNRTKDSEVLEHIAWLRIDYAQALVNVNRSDDAIAMMDEGLKTLDPKWKDIDKIRAGLLWILMDHLLELMHKKDYVAAIAFIKPRFEVCRNHQECADNLGIIYHNQAVEHWNAGRKNAAREAIAECVKLVPLAKECKSDADAFDR